MAQRALTSIVAKLATLAVIAVAFFGALVGTVYLALRSPEVKVPEIVGKNLHDAESALADAGLGVRTRARRYSAEVQPDTVLDQTPRPGELLKAGQTVAVVLSRAEARQGESSVGISREEDKKTDAEKAAAENANKSQENRNENENRPKRTANANNKNKNANNQNAGGNVNQNVTVNSNLNTNLVTNSAGATGATTTPQPAPTPTRTETPTPTRTATPAPAREGNSNAPAERPRTINGRNANAGNRNSAAPARNTNRRTGNN